MALPEHRSRRRPMLRALFSSSRHDRSQRRIPECRSAPRLHLAGDKSPRPRPALDEFPPSSPPNIVVHNDGSRRNNLVQRLRRPASSRPRHPEFVISEGADNLFLRERVLSEGDLTPRAPEPDIRRRASAAANEVRVARARAASLIQHATQSRYLHDDEDASDDAYFTSHRCIEVQSCRKLHFKPRCSTCPSEDDLLRRAQNRGSVAEPIVKQLQALHAQRAAYERGYQDELARLAHLVDALPVHIHDATCVIDLAKIQAGELVIRLPCMCVFHQSCLLEYFDTLEHPRCPVDRTPIPKSIIPYLPCWRWGDP